MQIFLLQLINENKARLNEQESKHCIKVLRHTVGDMLDCIDGKGTKFSCSILKADSREVELAIESREENWGETSEKIMLALSPLRLKDRFEWAIEKAVELGVDEIFPIICERTDLYKGKIKATRLTAILQRATKQCKRSRIPKYHETLSFEQFLEINIPGIQIMGYCEAQTLIQAFAPEIQRSSDVCFLIGPEGDFTKAESQLAMTHGVKLISFGENRLRSETAAIYALSSLKYMWGY